LRVPAEAGPLVARLGMVAGHYAVKMMRMLMVQKQIANDQFVRMYNRVAGRQFVA
jgi:hypothetical protein